MLTTIGRSYPGLLLGLLIIEGCGDDGGASLPDAPPLLDGSIAADAPVAPDACPGLLGLDVHFTDLGTGGDLFECGLTEIADPDHYALSDADGRARICATDGAMVDVIGSCLSSRDHYERISAAAMRRLVAAGVPSPIRALGYAYAPELAKQGIALPVADQVLVAVHVISLPTGRPLVGARVTTTATNSGVFSRQADGTFVQSDAVGDGGLVLISAVPISASPVISVTPPAGYAGTCVGPAEPILPMSGAVPTGLTFACQ